MKILALLNSKDTFWSPKSLNQYINKHLRSPKEAGSLREIPGYLDQSDRVIPFLVNRDLWEEVGLPEGWDTPDDDLLTNLALGRNASGDQLTRTTLRKMPREFILPLPCEVSEALQPYPLVGMAVTTAVTNVFLEKMESIAVCLGTREYRTWHKAKTLSMVFIHGTNQAFEAHLQSHVLPFGPAKMEDGRWRAFENWACLRNLHLEGGIRDALSTGMVKELARFGFEADLAPGKAAKDRPNGCTVVCPDGRTIHAGTVSRIQGAGILANQALKAILGVQPLTDRELTLVLRNSGECLQSIPHWKPTEYQVYKLAMLGFLDSDCRIKSNLEPIFQHLDDRMAMAQASLSDMDSPNRGRARDMIRNSRELLHFRVTKLDAEVGSGELNWNKKRDEMLRLVASLPAGLSQQGLPKETVDLLLHLNRGGFLEATGFKNHKTYLLSSKGRKKLVETYRDESEIEQALNCLRDRLLSDSASPELSLGRMDMVGLMVHGNELVFVKHGRAVECSSLLESLGVDSTTEISPDYHWWRRLWDERHALPPVLAESLISPEEIERRWPWLHCHTNEVPKQNSRKKELKPGDELRIAPNPEPRLHQQMDHRPHQSLDQDRARSI